jgi:Protein of unknown function (DUF2523)
MPLFLAPFLLLLARPLVMEVLLALGLGFVTFIGFGAGIANVKGMIEANIGQLPADMYNIVLLSGALQAMGIILSAITARIAVTNFSKIQRLK